MESKSRGRKIFSDKEGWKYKDGGGLVNKTAIECGHCGILCEPGKPDPCLGILPGVDFACCGHGDHRLSYVKFSSGIVVRHFTKISGARK